MENDVARLKQVIDWLLEQKVALSNRSIAEKMGYSPSSLSLIINGKVSITEKFVKSLCALDSRINPDWILSGIGAMIKEGTSFANPEVGTPSSTIKNGESIDDFAARMEYVTIMQSMAKLERSMAKMQSLYEQRISELEKEVAELKAICGR